jgi:PAS domain S-box-containing protein
VHGIFRDIRERKQVESALHETEALYRLLLQNANDTVFVHEISPDAPGRFLEFNEQASRLLGYTMDELAALSIDDIDVPEQVPRIPAIIRGLYETGGAIFATEWRAKDGRRIPVEISTRLFHVHGRPVVLSIGRDITERVRADELLRQSVHNMRRTLGGTINVIMAMVERRDPYTAGHQKRVADLARTIGTAMGLDGDRIEGLRVAGSIHDIGKIAIPLEILSKTTRLTELEMQLIREHSRAGHDILKDIEFPWPVARIVLEHHERQDGSGYPRGLTGDAILLESRILIVADVVEAMASHRPYRPAHGIEPVLAEIEGGRGLVYDPAAADACLNLFRRKGYRLVD